MCCGESGGCCRFRGGCVHCLGWGLIVLGVVGAVLAVVLDVLYAQYWFAPITLINAPIWGGVFVIVTGGLAVCSGQNPDKKGRMVAVLVLSIFATMAATCVWILAVIGVFIDGPQCEYFRMGPDRWWDAWYYSHDSLWSVEPGSWRDMDCTPAYAVHAVLIVIGLLEVAFALAVSIMSCCGTCCAPRDDTQGAVYRADGQQVIIVQGGAGPGQPSPQPGHKPYPVQQMPAQQVYPGQQQLYPGQPSPGQQPYPVQPSSGQQPYPVQPSPGQQPYPVQPSPGQQPYPIQPSPGQQPYSVQQQPYPQMQYSAPPPEQSSAIPSAPAPSYSEAVKGE